MAIPLRQSNGPVSMVDLFHQPRQVGIKLPEFLENAPGVYKVVINKQTKEPMLEFKHRMYEVPPKLYGELPKLINFYWNSFKLLGYKGGILLTGEPGSGKTELAKALCNNAIKEGMRVIDLSSVTLTEKVIDFLDRQDNVVLFFDEFAKIVGYMQEEILTLLSNPSGTRKIFILTENNKNRISGFIRNRPGRIRYAKHFDKLPFSVVKEYLQEQVTDIKFTRDVVALYKQMPKFAFDHLKAIVEEHQMHPELSLKEILEYLNLDFITGNKELEISTVIFKGKELDIIESDKVVLDAFINHSHMRLTVTVKVKTLEDANELVKEYDASFSPRMGMLGQQLTSMKMQQGKVDFMIPADIRIDDIELILTFKKDHMKEFIDEHVKFKYKDLEATGVIKLKYEKTDLLSLLQ